MLFSCPINVLNDTVSNRQLKTGMTAPFSVCIDTVNSGKLNFVAVNVHCNDPLVTAAVPIRAGGLGLTPNGTTVCASS